MRRCWVQTQRLLGSFLVLTATDHCQTPNPHGSQLCCQHEVCLVLQETLLTFLVVFTVLAATDSSRSKISTHLPVSHSTLNHRHTPCEALDGNLPYPGLCLCLPTATDSCRSKISTHLPASHYTLNPKTWVCICVCLPPPGTVAPKRISSYLLQVPIAG